MSDSILTYSNPRKLAVIDNWPYGKFRTTATFSIEQNKRGERAVRITVNPKNGRVNKPKACTYSPVVRIVDGSDGRTYIMAFTGYGHINVTQSDMQHDQENIHENNPRYDELLALLGIKRIQKA